MPLYEYRCYNGHLFQVLSSVAFHEATKVCECGMSAPQIISAPLMVKCAPDIGYDSPIDGRHITSWDARNEDLKRNNCREYDPEMKKDAARFHQEMDAKVDQQIDEQVERTFEKMPTKARGKLASEVLEQGVGLNVGRASGNPLA